jgi:hypothetical protein
MPDGYPTKAIAWAGSMLPRWNFAHQFAHNQIPGTSPGKPNTLVDSLLGRNSSNRATIDTISKGDVSRMAFCLASPEFQWC